MTCSDDCCAHKDRITLDEHQTARARVPGASRVGDPQHMDALVDVAEKMYARKQQEDADFLAGRDRPDHAALLAAESARLGRALAVIDRVRKVIDRVDEAKSAAIMVSAVRAALDGEPDGR